MNSPMNKTRRQVYVEISQVATQLQNIAPSSSLVKDVHICGLCKSSFSDICAFVEHKKTRCAGSLQLLPTPAPISQNQPSLGFATSGVVSHEDNITPIGSQYLRVTFDGSILNVEQSQSQHPLSNPLQCKRTEDSVLQTRLLSLPDQDPPVTDQSFQVSNEVQNSFASRREFHIDEEDVATLLANQLASEVVTSVDDVSVSSHNRFLDITSNMVSEPRSTLSTAHFPNKLKNQDESEAKGARDSGTSSQEPGSNADSVVDGLKGRKFHKCPDCMFTTQYLKDMVRHTRKHSGERPFECAECHRSFSRADKLLVHRRIHMGVKTHKCLSCDYATTDSGSLRKHMRIHNDERPFKCQICPYRSRDSSQLTVHLRTHTGDNPFACSYLNCSSSFKTSSDLKRHTRLHTGEKPFACTECDYRCAIKSNLRVHIRLNHSNRKIVPCKLCDYVASTRKTAKEHERTHTGNAKSQLRRENETSHGNRRGRGSGKEVERKGGRSYRRNSTRFKPFCITSYKCTFCEAAFVREDSWRSHVRQHKARDKQVVLGVVGSVTPVELQSTETYSTKEPVYRKKKLPSQASKSGPKPIKSKCGENSVVEGPEMEKIDRVVPPEQAELVEAQPVLLYVQNMPVVESAQLVSTPLLMASRCGQYVSVPMEQTVQYVVSAPLDGSAAYLQPADESPGPLQAEEAAHALSPPLTE